MTPSTVDFDLHQLVGIRLIGANNSDVQAVRRQLGVPESSLQAEPDIVIEYVDRLEMNTPLRHLVMGEAAFTDDAFFVCSKEDRLMQVPFDQLGQLCKLKAERGIGVLPLLNLMINLRMLAKGLMPIHASAFVYQDKGVLVSGWPKGGKTTMLFSFLSNGAQFISDDWLFVDSACRIYGLPQPIKLSDWQLEQLPQFQSQIKRKTNLTIQSVQLLDSVEKRIPASLRRSFLPAKVLNQTTHVLNKRLRHANLSPVNLFGDWVHSATGKLDIVFLTLSHNSPDIRVLVTDPQTALERLAHALRFEWSGWIEYYLQFLYAFPGHVNSLMEQYEELQHEHLSKLLAGKPIYTVYHPHPLSMSELYNAVRPYIS
jgi:hypothetical protein